MIKNIAMGLGIAVLLAVLAVFASASYNETLEPPQLVTNFVDIEKVKQISKFRSCSGHTNVPQEGGELKRNMKHYIGLHPEYHQEHLVEVYAPYDGYIALLFGKEEIWIASGRKSVLGLLPIDRWMFGVTHVLPKEGLRMGDSVKAGEIIGYGTFAMNERGYPAFDVLYGTIHVPPKKVEQSWTSVFGKLDSVFDHMSPEVLSQYEKKGITRENIIIKKEERDNDPCVYKDGGPYFEYKNGSIESVELRK